MLLDTYMKHPEHEKSKLKVKIVNIVIPVDKSGFQVNSFLVSQRMLWVLIRSASYNIQHMFSLRNKNEYTEHMFSLRNKKTTTSTKNIDTFRLEKEPYQEICILCVMKIPVSILYKSIVGRYRPVRVADGPIMAHYRFTQNASWDI